MQGMFQISKLMLASVIGFTTMFGCGEKPMKGADSFEQAVEAQKSGDKAKTMQLLREAAEAGHTTAMCRLGQLCFAGYETGKADPAAAIQWITRAAEAVLDSDHP